MEMNENPTYEHDTNAKMENKDIQKYIENHNKSMIKQTFKGRLILEDKSRYAIDEIYRRFKRIIPKL
jgi:translation initiation factor IF-3